MASADWCAGPIHAERDSTWSGMAYSVAHVKIVQLIRCQPTMAGLAYQPNVVIDPWLWLMVHASHALPLKGLRMAERGVVLTSATVNKELLRMAHANIVLLGNRRLVAGA